MMHNEVFCMPVPKRYDRGEKIAAVFHQHQLLLALPNPMRVVTAQQTNK